MSSDQDKRNLRKSLAKQSRNAIESRANAPVKKTLRKHVKPAERDKNIEGYIDKAKFAFSPESYYRTKSDGVIEHKGIDRLTDEENKIISRYDPTISGIISNRSNQCLNIGRPSLSRFNPGSRIKDIEPPQLEDFQTRGEFEKEKQLREKEKENIMEWVQSCGTKDKSLINAMFSESHDKSWRISSFSDYLAASCRNLLIFNRSSTQKFRYYGQENSEDNGRLIAFRPAPVEVIHPVDPEVSEMLLSPDNDNVTEQAAADALAWSRLPHDLRPSAYVQKIEGRIVGFWTEDDMSVIYGQKQALFGLNGYPLTPIEQCIYMVNIHQNTLEYLSNTFTKGLSTKGAFFASSTDEFGQALSEDDADAIRDEITNYLQAVDNSAAIPFFSGPFKLEFIPLMPNPKDMEWVQVEESVIRALCTAFTVDPSEIGYGHLSTNSGSLGNNGKQEDVVRGEERGLKPLLDVIFNDVNDMLYEAFPQARGKYELVYEGVGSESRESVQQNLMTEMQTTATMSSMLSASEQTILAPIGGELPLNQQFWNIIERNYTHGEILEAIDPDRFKGASQKPEWDFYRAGDVQGAIFQMQEMQMQQEQAEQMAQMGGDPAAEGGKEEAAEEERGVPGQEQAAEMQKARDEEHARTLGKSPAMPLKDLILSQMSKK